MPYRIAAWLSWHTVLALATMRQNLCSALFSFYFVINVIVVHYCVINNCACTVWIWNTPGLKRCHEKQQKAKGRTVKWGVTETS